MLALSLFSGAGGLDIAFERTGLVTTISCMDFSRDCINTLEINRLKLDDFTYRAYLPNAKIINVDLSNATIKSIQHLIDNEVDIIYGGPPCQSFSVLGKRGGMLDKRGDLTNKFVDTITGLKPRAFLMENVPGLLTIGGGQQFAKLINKFIENGYQVSYGVLCAADYGAATLRKRLFVIGARDTASVSLPLPTHCNLLDQTKSTPLFTSHLKPWVPCGVRLNDPNALENLDNQTFVQHKAKIVERFSALAFGERDHKRRRNRLNPNLPSHTLFAGGGKLKGQSRAHIHPYQNREITPRECAEIHGFPRNWVFYGEHDSCLQQVANSVPIELGSAIAKHMMSYI